jgi:diguanylate cyclase (GGDEF)-like protein
LDEFLKSNKDTYENTFRVASPNGSLKWIYSKGVAERNKEGKVIRMAGSHTNITSKLELENKLFKRTYCDKLTDLRNKDRLIEDFNELIRKRKGNLNLAFVYIDIDNFKYINNVFGYEVGNQLILKLAEIIQERYTLSHLTSRLESDEFLILFKDFEDIKELEKEIINFLEVIRNTIFFHNQEAYVSVSLGVSVYNTHGSDFNELFKYADIALFYAKQNGKDQYRFYEEKMFYDINCSINMTNQLRQAIEKEEFMMHYQPIVCVSTGEMAGVEALIRWTNALGDFVSPAEFIPIAETSGQIKKIELWIFEEVCRQIKKWTEHSSNPFFVSVNLSAKGLIEKKLEKYLISLTELHEVDPKYIQLEITETALLHNIDKTFKVLNNLRQKGFKISLDDFGIGYSSLNYLKTLPIDKVKLDKTFIDSIDKSDKDKVLLSYIINLSHALNLKVVAEGVETASQNALLKLMNCDFIQGYFYGRPEKPEYIQKIIEKL